MPSPAEIDELIRVRAAMGEAQKHIARELGVTEWRVRTVLRSQLTATVVKRGQKEVRLHTVTAKAPRFLCRVAVLSDIHIPYHDHGALAIAMAFLREWQPSVIVLNGDILDFHEVSSHPKERHNVITFQDEIDEGRQFLRVLRHDHPRARICYTMGNHENRIERYLTNHAPELSSVTSLSLCTLLDLPDLAIEFFDAREKVAMHGVEFFHGSIIRKDAGNSVRAHVAKRGGSVVMGHTHRMATVARRDKHGTAWGIENGHLSNPDPSWCLDPDWQQGFTTLELTDDAVSIQQRVVEGGRMLADGKVWEASDGAGSGEGRAGSTKRVARGRSGARHREPQPRRGARKGRPS